MAEQAAMPSALDREYQSIASYWWGFALAKAALDEDPYYVRMLEATAKYVTAKRRRDARARRKISVQRPSVEEG